MDLSALHSGVNYSVALSGTVVLNGGLNRYFTISQEFYIPEIQILIEHSLTEFPALQFAGGEYLSGTVNWGDEQSSSYTESHSYESEGAKTVEYSVLGADSFTIKSLDDISRIIISK